MDKIKSGQFVHMKELLVDNIHLLQQLEAVQGLSLLPGLPGVARPRLREVTSLTTWLYCFLSYMAIRTSDSRTFDQLSYAKLIIREAHRHGGGGWLEYDHRLP